MIYDELWCNGCNICVCVCCKINYVFVQGSCLLIVYILVIDNDNEMQYYFFCQLCQYCEDVLCIDVCLMGVLWCDEQGIVWVEKLQCIGCSYCIGVCLYQVCYFNFVIKVVDKCDFCVEF